MYTEIKKLIKHSSIYSFGNLSGHILSFLLLPVYTRLLTTEEYGILAIIGVFRTIFQRIVNLGTQSSVVKVYFEVDNTEKRKEVASTAFIFLTVIAGIFTLWFWLCREKLSIFLLDSPHFGFLFSFALITSFFYIIKTVPLSVFRAQGRAFTYTIFAFLTLVLGLLFNIIFVIIFRENVTGILKSSLLSHVIVFVLVLIPFWKNFVFKFKKEYLSRMLSFGLPIVPSGLAIWILTLLDRYFLKVFADMETVGIYSLGYKIATIMSMLVIVPFSMAWSPLMLRWYKQKKAKELFTKTFKYFSIFGFFLVLAISLFSKDIIRVMTTPAFFDAYKIVYFITLAYLFQGFYMIFTTGCTFVRKTYYFPIATGVAAGLNTILNILLIPKYQMIGAAVATVFSYLVMTILMYLFSEKYYHIPFEFNIGLKIFFVTTLLYIAGLFVGGKLVTIVVTKLILLVGFFVFLFLFKVFNNQEIAYAKAFLRKRKSV